MIWVWIAVVAAAIIVESLSAQLVSIWFALGGFVSLVLSLFDVSVTIQVVVFFAVSIVSLIILLPFARKMLKKEHIKTNADRYIGQTGIVTQDISNIDACGQVKVDNQIWSARSENGNNISEGTKVRILKIEGVKLIVASAE